MPFLLAEIAAIVAAFASPFNKPVSADVKVPVAGAILATGWGRFAPSRGP